MSCSTQENQKFFTQDICALFEGGLQLFPSETDSYATRLNALARLVILTFLILLVFSVKYAWIFLCLALILIVLFYYLGNKNDCNEHYSDLNFSQVKNQKGKREQKEEEQQKEENFNSQNSILSFQNNQAKTTMICSDQNNQNMQTTPLFPLTNKTIGANDTGNARDEFERRIMNRPLQPLLERQSNGYQTNDYSNFTSLNSGTNPRQFIPPIIATPAFAEENSSNRSTRFGNHRGEYLQPFLME